MMIEPNLVKWLDLVDTMQKSEIYSKGKFIILFRFFKILLKYKSGNIILVIILKLIFFIQIMMIPIINSSNKESKHDSLIKFFNSIKQIIFIQDLIKNKTDYIIFLSIAYFLIIFLYSTIIYILIYSNSRIHESPVRSLNIFNLLLLNYLLCPIINVTMLSIKCENSRHIFLGSKCFSDISHLVYVAFSIFSLLSFLFYSFLLSLFYYRVGSTKGQDLLIRVNCNYEFYVNILTILYYFFSFYLYNYTKDTQSNFQLYNRIIFFCISLFLFLYIYFEVFFYNKIVNALNLYGWGFLCWYSMALLLKTAFEIKDVSIFVFIGMIGICFILFYLDKYNTEYYLTQSNILEANSIKTIEKFTYNLLDITTQTTVKSKTLVSGIINSIEEFFKTQSEIYEKYNNFVDNKKMIKKLGGKSNVLFNIYNIIYVIYDFYLEKAEMKDNIMIILCYFLMNQLKNATYAGFLSSSIKVNGFLTLYYKYLLVEDIKDFLISKLLKNSANKDSIKHIEIGSVIVYNNYIDNFKMKIYDAACNQIDYFDILKNNTLTSKTTQNFLQLGDTILHLRKEINDLWNKIIKLNPFSDEIEKDYMLYLRTIIQDEDLAQKEEKRYNHIKMSKLNEKLNMYHSLFDKDISTVVLVDGCGVIGKVIYVTPNFGTIFNFLPKELVNVMITDIQPNCVSKFHKDIMNDALKYSNLNFIYKGMINVFMKGKGNGIFNINAFVKCLPNFDYGFIYILAVQKIKDNHFILLLDEDFIIDAMTNPFNNVTGNFALNNINNYNLNNNVIGYHCALIIPDILKLIKYDGKKFVLLKKDIDLKSILYSNTENCNDFKSYIDNVLDRIKQSGQLIFDENSTPLKQSLIAQNSEKLKKEQNLQEFKELISKIKEKCENKSYNIFYRISCKKFLNGKHILYKIYISNDLMSGNELNNTLINQLNLSQKSVSKKSEKNKKEKKEEKEEKIKGIKVKVSEDNKNENKEKKNLENEENNNIENPLSQNSITTKNSLDNASFNKLKSRILEKNESNIITYMKISSFFFLIMTIIFIFLNSNNAKSKLKYLERYLDENFFFNHTKITTACIYATGVNLKLIKYKILNDSTCKTSNSCKEKYSKLLLGCLDDIKTETAEIAFFDIDYKMIMGIKNNITIYIYNLTTFANVNLDGPNLLNYILSSGLRFENHIDEYINEKNSDFQIYGENVINQSFYYINNKDIEGYDKETMKNKITEKRFSTNYIFVILNCVVFVTSITVLIWMTVKLYKIQTYFISKLVKFHSPNFENYIKYLEDLKKKLRNDSGEDDEKNEENQSNENNNENSKEEEINKKEKRDSMMTKDQNKENKRDKKKMKGKFSKIQQQKLEKIKVMSKYIFQFNVFLSLKILILFILSMLYYVIVFILYLKNRKEYFIFDDIINSIYGIYKDCDIIFANVLNEANLYEKYNIEKENLISDLKEGKIEIGTFENEKYTLNNISKLSDLNYKMKIPSSSEVAIPKVNNILLPIISNVKMDKSSTKSKLAQLFNGDICDIIFEDDIEQYKICSTFWSSILKQGLIQCITQLSVEINTVLTEMDDLNNNIITFYDFINKSTFSQLETFVNFYFLEAFRKNDDLFAIMRKDRLNVLHKILNILLIFFLIGLFTLFVILLFIIYSAKNMFSSFLGFIGIIPIQYLFEDEFFYKDVLNLEENIFD